MRSVRIFLRVLALAAVVFGFAAAPSALAEEEVCDYCTWCSGGTVVCCAPTWPGYMGWDDCTVHGEHCHASSQNPNCTRLPA